MTVPKVVIDSAILVTPRLSALPIELIPIAGRQIGVNDLKDVHALLTRTVTRVDAHLLQDSRIGFVGTASAGTDHIDTRYLSATLFNFSDDSEVKCRVSISLIRIFAKIPIKFHSKSVDK